MSFFTTADGVKLYYSDEGNGHPIVLLHGWPLSSASWDYHASRLIECGYRVIRYDRRGFGRSGQPSTGYDYDSLALDLKVLMQHLNLNAAVLVGFSMAAGEVVRYLSRYGSEAVSAVVLVSGVTPLIAQSENNPQGMPAIDFSGFEQALVDNLGLTLHDYAYAQFSDHVIRSQYLAMVRQASPRAVLETARSWYATDFHEDLAALDVPTLILHGSADQSAPTEYTGRKAHALIASSRYIEYEGVGHYLPYEEKEGLIDDLLVFMDESIHFST